MCKSRPWLRCTTCGKEWSSQHDVLEDKKLVMNGYMPDLMELRDGLLLFTHHAAGCGTTLAVRVGEAMHLLPDELGLELRRGDWDCPGHCLKVDVLDACGAKCRAAVVRELMQVFRKGEVGNQLPVTSKPDASQRVVRLLQSERR
jgi:hypothetical protein